LQATAAGTPQTPFRATVAPTDIEKAYNDYNNAMMQAYQAKVAQQNAMWGGLAQLGGAAILGAGGFGGMGSGLSSILGSSPSYGGGNMLSGDAYGGSASSPLPGLTAADYG
jgi:hypothetical protein